MTQKELTAAEVRELPEGTKVMVHKTDKYGYPCRGTYYVHMTQKGKKVLMNFNPFHDGFMEIRAQKGTRYTVEVKEDEADRCGRV